MASFWEFENQPMFFFSGGRCLCEVCFWGSGDGTDQLVAVLLQTETQQSQEGSQSELHTTQHNTNAMQSELTVTDQQVRWKSNQLHHHNPPTAGNTIGWRYNLQSLPIRSRTRWGSRPWWPRRHPAPPAEWTDWACSVQASGPGTPSAWSLQVTSSSSRQTSLSKKDSIT